MTGFAPETVASLIIGSAGIHAAATRMLNLGTPKIQWDGAKPASGFVSILRLDPKLSAAVGAVLLVFLLTSSVGLIDLYGSTGELFNLFPSISLLGVGLAFSKIPPLENSYQRETFTVPETLFKLPKSSLVLICMLLGGSLAVQFLFGNPITATLQVVALVTILVGVHPLMNRPRLDATGESILKVVIPTPTIGARTTGLCFDGNPQAKLKGVFISGYQYPSRDKWVDEYIRVRGLARTHKVQDFVVEYTRLITDMLELDGTGLTHERDVQTWRESLWQLAEAEMHMLEKSRKDDGICKPCQNLWYMLGVIERLSYRTGPRLSHYNPEEGPKEVWNICRDLSTHFRKVTEDNPIRSMAELFYTNEATSQEENQQVAKTTDRRSQSVSSKQEENKPCPEEDEDEDNVSITFDSTSAPEPTPTTQSSSYSRLAGSISEWFFGSNTTSVNQQDEEKSPLQNSESTRQTDVACTFTEEETSAQPRSRRFQAQSASMGVLQADSPPSPSSSASRNPSPGLSSSTATTSESSFSTSREQQRNRSSLESILEFTGSSTRLDHHGAFESNQSAVQFAALPSIDPQEKQTSRTFGEASEKQTGKSGATVDTPLGVRTIPSGGNDLVEDFHEDSAQPIAEGDNSKPHRKQDIENRREWDQDKKVPLSSIDNSGKGKGTARTESTNHRLNWCLMTCSRCLRFVCFACIKCYDCLRTRLVRRKQDAMPQRPKLDVSSASSAYRGWLTASVEKEKQYNENFDEDFRDALACLDTSSWPVQMLVIIEYFWTAHDNNVGGRYTRASSPSRNEQYRVQYAMLEQCMLVQTSVMIFAAAWQVVLQLRFES